MSGVGLYLQDKLRIAKMPPSKWVEELERLPPEKRAEIEPYLRQQADILRFRREMARNNGAKRV